MKIEFLFSWEMPFSFLNLMEARPNMKSPTLRNV